MFRIDGPAVVSFSGGRTSALMTRRILDTGLWPDVHVLFANTGKERDETLDFIHECETRWQIRIVWLQRPPNASEHESGYVEVDYCSAARQGDAWTPFDQLITERRCLPNPAHNAGVRRNSSCARWKSGWSRTDTSAGTRVSASEPTSRAG